MKMTLPPLMVALVTILGTVSCKDEGCNVPAAFNYDPDGSSDENCIYEPLTLRFSAVPYFGDEPATQGAEYTTEDGRILSFEYIGIYLSEIRLKQGDRSIKPDLDLMLLRFGEESIQTTAYPQGDIDGLEFTIGVDSTEYYIDPATYDTEHPLGPKDPPTYWGWATGYRFISLEGRVDTSASGDNEATGFFTYHTGLDTCLRYVSVGSRAIDIRNREIHVSLRVDLEALVENIDFRTELVTHTMNNLPLALKISDNAETAISILP